MVDLSMTRGLRPRTNGKHPYKRCMYSNDNTSLQTSGRCITQLAKMSTDPKLIERKQLICLVIFYEGPVGYSTTTSD